MRWIWFHQPEVLGYLGYFWIFSVFGWQKLPPKLFFLVWHYCCDSPMWLSLGISFGMGKSAQEGRLVAFSWTWPRLIRYKEIASCWQKSERRFVEITRISKWVHTSYVSAVLWLSATLNPSNQIKKSIFKSIYRNCTHELLEALFFTETWLLLLGRPFFVERMTSVLQGKIGKGKEEQKTGRYEYHQKKGKGSVSSLLLSLLVSFLEGVPLLCPLLLCFKSPFF